MSRIENWAAAILAISIWLILMSAFVAISFEAPRPINYFFWAMMIPLTALGALIGNAIAEAWRTP